MTEILLKSWLGVAVVIAFSLFMQKVVLRIAAEKEKLAKGDPRKIRMFSIIFMVVFILIYIVGFYLINLFFFSTNPK
jgi:Na+/proline symporter